MEPFQLIIIQNEYQKEKEKLGALVERLKSDLKSYMEKNPTPTANQKIHIEIRQSVIQQIITFIELSETLIDALTEQIYTIQSDISVQALRTQVAALQKRSKKMEMVLTLGFNYNISLLEYQHINDFV